MRDEQEDNIQFKMRMDGEVEESVIPSQVDDLRIEKLNYRMTLISILIPVLIVVILGVAYLDIKRRVVRTEDSGQMTAQTLSEDLQSRFSSLSLGQATIEENFARLKDQSEQSIAKVQVNLNKLENLQQQSSKTMASRSDMKSTAAKLEKNLDRLDQSIKALDQQTQALDQQMQALDQSMKQELKALTQSLAHTSDQFAGINTKLSELEASKIDKAALDLSLKLEILKLKQVFNSRMDATQSKVDDVQSKIKAIERQIAASKSVQSAVVPQPAAPSPFPSSSGSLEEQTIK